MVVTQKTKDGGVDLTAIKEGLSEINNTNSVSYRIQAKRNTPTSLIHLRKLML